MLMIDGDYPMASGGVHMKRDLTLPIGEVRSQTEYLELDLNRQWTMASIPEMRRSGMAAA